MGPFKCPDCGVWWAGYEHRCRWEPSTTTSITWPTVLTGTTSRCSCSFDPMGHRIPTTALCPIHDTTVTYTS